MNGMSSKSNHQVIHPAIQASVDFLERLESDVEKASVRNDIRVLYEKFAAFCVNLSIAQSLGNHAYDNDTCNDDFRKELLSNIDMAKSVCLSKRDGFSSNQFFTISNNNQQEQNQTQSLAINLFLEAIKDDLTGRQVKELKKVIAKSSSDKEKARDGIIAKLKSFGDNVAANIVANILTNPVIWGGL